MKGTFKARVFRNIVLLVLVVSCSFAFLYAGRQRKLLEEELIRHGTTMAAVFASNLRLGLYSESDIFLMEPVYKILEQEEILQAAVYTSDGRLLKREGRTDIADLEDPAQVVAKIREVKSPVYFNGTQYSEFWSPVFYYRSRISNDSGFFPTPTGEKVLLGFVKLSLSRKNLIEGTKSIIFGTVVVTVVFIFVGGVIAYYVAAKVTTPLRSLISEIRAMERDGIKKVPLEGDAEIAELAATFNNMAEAIKKREVEQQKAEKEKRKLERMYYQAQKIEALGRLAGGIAHDFNNILTVILSNVELARMRAAESISEYVERVLTAVERGKGMVKNLLQSYRGIPANSKPLNLGWIVKETVRLLDRDVDKKIKVRVDVMPGLWSVYANPVQLQEVVMNLYLNARDAIVSLMEKGETSREYFICLTVDNVEVSDRYTDSNLQVSRGEFVRLTVTDNGCGMDEETVSHAFDLFFTTKGDKGSGIGLSTVYEIVNQHGGWIDVKSEPNTGTTFRVYLPRWKGDSTVEEAEIPEEPLGGSETILLVDDEQYIADAAKEMLECLGYTVLLAYSGEDALQIYREEAGSIDLIVLDMIMPGLSGAEVLRRVKQIDSDAKIIISSGTEGQLPDRIAPDIEVISKPYTLNELARKIRGVLGAEKTSRSIKQHLKRVKVSYIKERTIPYEEKVTNSKLVYELFGHRLSCESREIFIVLFLDAQKRIVAYEEIAKGTVSETVVYPQEVVKTALLTNAASIILVHNHPSGETKPSLQDMILTADVMAACEAFNIELTDHIIIGEGKYFSFAEDNLLYSS
jgi:hypothetical protein